MFLAPDASLEDGLLDIVIIADVPSCASCASCPPCSRASTCASPTSRCRARRRVEISADRPFTAVRRRRSDRASCRSTVARAARRGAGDRPAAMSAARRQDRRRPRGRRAGPAGRARRRHEPARQGAHARWSPHAIGGSPARLPRGIGVISATNGKTTTAAMAAAILERAGIALVHNRAGANMAGGVASTLLGAARTGGADRRRARPVRGRRVLARPASAAELAPRAMLLGNLFRDQLDRYGELETIADRWAGRGRRPARDRAGPQRRRPAGRRPRRASRAATLLRRRGSRDGGRPRCSMPRTPSTAAAAAPPTSTRPSTSATSASTTARTAASAARSRASRADEIELHGTRGATLRAAHPGRAAPLELPLPGLYNVYNALAAAALCLALGVAAGADRRGPGGGDGRRSAAPRRVEVGGARAVDPAGQEPGRRQRDPAHAGARAGELDVLGDPQRPHRRRPRHLVGLGRRLRDARRPRAPRHVRRHARRRAGAAAQVRGRADASASRVPSLPAALDRALERAGARARCSRCPPTPRCWSCARSWRRAGTSPHFWERELPAVSVDLA